MLDGTVRSRWRDRHRHQAWSTFLKRIDTQTPAELALHLSADHDATHTHPTVRSWLTRHPRVHRHVTPTSSAWVNLVARWCRESTDTRIRRGVFRSVSEWVSAIHADLEEQTRDPTPFIWTAKADEIVANVRRARTKLDTMASE